MATVLDFNSLSFNNGGAPNIVGFDYDEDRFHLHAALEFEVQYTFPDLGFGVWGTSGENYPGSPALLLGARTGNSVLTRDDGTAFNLVSIDLGEQSRFFNNGPVSVTFTGRHADNSVVSQTFTTDGPFGLQRFFFSAAFDNVVEVRWTADGNQFDNIVIDAARPVANPDSVSTDEDVLLTSAAPGVLVNDAPAVAGNALTAALVSGPTHGTLILNANGSFNYTPTLNYNGADSFTYTVNDGTATSSAATVSITVTAVNDAPSFIKGAEQSVQEDSGAHTVAGWATNISAGPADESGQTVLFNVTGNTNPDLFSTAPAVGSDGTLTYTLAADAYGTATITLVAQDNGGGSTQASGSQSFQITVNPVNDAPSFTGGSDQTVDEDSGPQSVVGWATDVSSGPNESSQTIHFNVTNNTNPDLFDVAPAVAPDGTLTYTPAANAHGTASITIAAQDNGGGTDTSAPQTFQITVNAVNDPPDGTDNTVTTIEDNPYTFTTADFGFTDPNDTPQNNLAAVKISSLPTAGTLFYDGNPITQADVTAGFEVSADDIGNGLLTFKPDENGNGAAYATFDFQVRDDGGGSDLDPTPNTMTVDVTPVNDAPTLEATGNDPSFTENDPPVDLFDNVTASAIESGQNLDQLMVTVTNVAGTGATESLTIDGTAVELTDGNTETTTNGLTASVVLSGGTATVTISKIGGISASDMETLVDNLAYGNTSDDPGSAERVVTLTSVRDTGPDGGPNGDDNTTDLSIDSTVFVTPVNDAPTIHDVNPTASYTEDDPPTTLSDQLTVEDVDNANLVHGTVRITDGQPDDVLAADVSGTGITATYDAASHTLVLSGDDTVEHYQQVLRTVTYASTSQDPAAVSASRNIEWQVNDGTTSFQGQVQYGDSVMAPAGLAAGDFNGDGFADLAVANFGCEDVSILLNNGDGTFTDQGAIESGSSPAWVVARDLNNDGFLDLAVANADSDNVSVMLGRGDGTFDPAQSFDAGDGPVSIAAGDFDGDGFLDLVTANALLGGFSAIGSGSSALSPVNFQSDGITVLRGQGTGQFDTAVGYQTDVSSVYVAVGDLDGNSSLDLAVANFDGSLSLLFNDGLGTFGPPTDIALTSAVAVAIGDLNNDGIADLVTANGDGSVSVLLGNKDVNGNADGTFAAPLDTIACSDLLGIATADINGDGRLDVVVSEGSGNAIFLQGNGDGTFATPLEFAVGSTPVGIVAQDLDNDGRIDLALSSMDEWAVSVLLNDSTNLSAIETTDVTVTSVNDSPELTGVATTVSFHAGTPVTLAPNAEVSDPDNVTLASATVRISDGSFLGDNDVLSVDPSLLAPNTNITAVYDPATHTLTLSGPDTLANYQQALDFVTFSSSGNVTNSGANPTRTIEWQLNDGETQNNLSDVSTTIVNLRSATVADFNGDGHSDLLWRNASGHTSIWEMNGAQQTAGFDLGVIGSSWHALNQGDFNGDGFADIVWRNDSGSTCIWEMNRGTIQAGIDLGTIGPSWQLQPLGDFNGDGMTDMLWRDEQTGQTAMWLMNNGRIDTVVDMGVIGAGWHVASVADFNGDHMDDILWRHESGQTTIWEENGGTVQNGIDLGTIGTSWHVAGAGDFDGDGTDQILWRNDNGQTAMWQLDGSQVNGADMGMVTTSQQVATIGDFNGDGASDILWRNNNGNTILWEMSGSQSTAQDNVATLPTSWQIVNDHLLI